MTEPGKTEPGKTELGKTEPEKTESGKTEPGKTVRMLQADLRHYDRIFLFQTAEWLEEFLEAGRKYGNGRKILILSLEAKEPGSMGMFGTGNITLRTVSQETLQQLLALYYTYEFSDRFMVISPQNAPYASPENYIVTGLLSREEVLKAALS